MWRSGKMANQEIESALVEIRKLRHEAEALRHLPAPTVDILREMGCYRAFVPGSLGGDELSPAAFCRLIEKIAVADASTAWVASFGVSAVYLGGLPSWLFEQIYRDDPDTVFAGALFPVQSAQASGDTIQVKGYWKYGSGIMGASLAGVGVKVDGWDDGGLPRVAVMPKPKVEVVDAWDTIGLTGTGSHDIAVHDVEVSRDWTFVRGGKSLRDEAIFRYPAMAIAAQVLAVVGLGAAREALDELKVLARGNPSITAAPSLAQRGYVQTELARGEALLAGARSYFYDGIERAWQITSAGDELSKEQRVELRLAATHAAHAGAEAARIAFVAGGTRAIDRGHPLGRAMNDAAAVAQHAFLGLGTFENAGGALLDQPAIPGYP